MPSAHFLTRMSPSSASLFMPENTIADFSLPGTGNQTFTLSGARGKHPIPRFYPEDDTPGCARNGNRPKGCSISTYSLTSL
ncbi:MAG: redoxin domain-containing protein [Gallionella sp.]|nr:MAG: redoxin domain-containing protein [Gallionella sp.]